MVRADSDRASIGTLICARHTKVSKADGVGVWPFSAQAETGMPAISCCAFKIRPRTRSRAKLVSLRAVRAVHLLLQPAGRCLLSQARDGSHVHVGGLLKTMENQRCQAFQEKRTNRVLTGNWKCYQLDRKWPRHARASTRRASTPQGTESGSTGMSSAGCACFFGLPSYGGTLSGRLIRVPYLG